MFAVDVRGVLSALSLSGYATPGNGGPLSLLEDPLLLEDGSELAGEGKPLPPPLPELELQANATATNDIVTT